MPRIARERTALYVSQLRKNGRYSVGGVAGLHLDITGGSRTWLLRITIKRKRCDLGFGSYPEISLAAARDYAREFRRQIRGGRDPITERRAQRAEQVADEKLRQHTFEICANTYIEDHRAAWKNKKHVYQWTQTIEQYANPKIGKLWVGDVTTEHVLAILKPIWATKTETASRLRGRIEKILDSAKVKGYRQGENPARWKGHLDAILPAKGKVHKVEHHPALPYTRAGVFMAHLRQRDGIGAKALRFGILTATRNDEVRGAAWQEIDLARRRWTIPGPRMKREKEHVIPLSDETVELLESLPRIEGCDLLFPAPEGGKLSDAALGAVIERMHEADLGNKGIGYVDPTQENAIVTPHGWRSTFRDWAAEIATYPRTVVEHALAHGLKDKTEAAYQRGTLLQKRKRLMQEWAEFLKVIYDESNVHELEELAAAA